MRPHTLLRHLLLVVTLALPAGAQVVRTDFREYTSPVTPNMTRLLARR